MIVTPNLYQKVLIDPRIQGLTTLYIVSGYATPGMVIDHLNTISQLNLNIKINLIIGMSFSDGISEIHHREFQRLVSSFPNQFSCQYITVPPEVHSKVYIWSDNNNLPVSGFTGSANYTQKAFGKNQREILTSCDPQQGFNYYNSLLTNTTSCTNVSLTTTIPISRRSNKTIIKPFLTLLPQSTPVTLSLLDSRTGDTPKKSGINWGHRGRKNIDEAYITVPARISKTQFFPPAADRFDIITDDNQTFKATIAQQGEKAIETPDNNAILGEYFRDRLAASPHVTGVARGTFITLQHLQNYGRTNVDFYKIDDETYYMDFHV